MKENKVPGINLTKEVKKLDSKNTDEKQNKTQKTKMTQIYWKMQRYTMLTDWINVKMSILPKAIYRFNAVSQKIPSFWVEFHRDPTENSKIHM